MKKTRKLKEITKQSKGVKKESKRMPEKKIAITISRPPHGNENMLEGLRMAIGLCAGEHEHKVSVIFCDEGVYNVLSDIVWDEAYEKCWNMMEKLNLNLYVDKESMKERGIVEADMDNPLTMLKRKEINEILCSSDVHIDF